MPTITRFSPDSCGCVLERQVSETGEISFLLMNEVCDDHAHLASTTFRANHGELSQYVMSLIEEAKALNMNSARARFQEPRIARSAKLRKELQGCITQIELFNQQITEEWNELTQQPHAFDSHIHDVVMDEGAIKGAAQNHFIEYYGKDEPFQWNWSGIAPNRICIVKAPHDVDNFRARVNTVNRVLVV